MDFFYVVIKSLVSIIVLFFLTKIMGRKQISQLNLYDYVVGITIGSVAAEVSTNVDSNFLFGIVVMTVYSLVSVIISYLTEKSINLRRFFIGVPIVIIEDGQILEDSLKKSKFDINDLLEVVRIAGYFDLSEVEYALMEANGTLSILPKSENKAVTRKDMSLKAEKQGLCSNVIIDGIVLNMIDTAGIRETNDVVESIGVKKSLNLINERLNKLCNDYDKGNSIHFLN